jgi:soluble lytic murein transglycosylase-like protein
MANLQQAAGQSAKKYGLNPTIFKRQIRAESGFNAHAVSPAGARGVAQIMPGTARAWGVNADDPYAALDAAAKHMAQYVKQYGSYAAALTAYNAGPGAVGHKLPRDRQVHQQDPRAGGPFR